MRNIGWAALAGFAVSNPALADWAGKAEAGLVIASGNAETQTANAKLQFANETDAWKHEFGGAGLYASDEVGTTADRWDVFGQSDYNFSDRTFWFGAARYEQDEFSGFEFQVAGSIGLGRKFIDTAATKLSSAAGVGYKFFETRDAFDDAGALIEEGSSDNEIIVRGTLDLDHRLTETASLINKLVVEAGADNTFAHNEVGVAVKINAVLALAIGYSVRHNTDPPAGFEKTDTLTTVNLVYELN